MTAVMFRTAALVMAMSGAACGAVRTSAIRSVADTLASGGGGLTSHNDPELIEDALPFALTLYESLLGSVPKHEPLLTATCAAYTQFGFGFVQAHAEETQFVDYERSQRYTRRALSLIGRGRDYCWRGLAVRFGDIAPRLQRDPAAAVAASTRSHVPLIYWSAASLASAIALGGVDHPELLIHWPIVRALAERARDLDENWGNGAILELLMTVESQGEALGGSEPRARQYFARAVALQHGLSPGPYVGLAMGLARSRQDRQEFETLLRSAIAIDPDRRPETRLVTLMTQKRARHLLDHVDELFLEDRHVR